ncbi:alpha/beta hydrolase [Kribbella lupini]|uniref:alpha/beta fold hydrolase n=1 Tax=Kribbella lupini TaxID=291602 RepID=UPI0031E005AF
MFEGFTLDHIDVGDAVLRVRYGGSGPPVVLLQGHPRTHTTWYAVAPALANAGFSVVCPDLRGYGGSSKPITDAEHTPYSARAKAYDIVGLMSALGHERFAVVGHDRGCYVAYRTALDHPGRVSKLVVMDAPRTTPTSWPPYGIPRPSTRCSRTTVPASASTVGPTRTTVTPAGRSPARSWFCGPLATTWRSCTATRSRSGNPGANRSAATGSTRRITSPRTHPPTWS